MDNKQRVCAYGLIIKDGKILIVQRSQKDTHPNLWELPGGGIEFGEHPKDTVLRETYEETGLKVKVKRPLTIISQVDIHKNYTHNVIRIIYECSLVDKNSQVNLSNEHKNYKWLSINDSSIRSHSDFLSALADELTSFGDINFS